MRVLCADTHPDHDTIGTFRRENKELAGEAFVKVLEIAHKLKVSLEWTWVSVAYNLKRLHPMATAG